MFDWCQGGSQPCGENAEVLSLGGNMVPSRHVLYPLNEVQAKERLIALSPSFTLEWLTVSWLVRAPLPNCLPSS